MEMLIEQLCEILEVDELPLDVRFDEMAEWDSLNTLSVIALLESNYNLQIDAEGLKKFENIAEFIQHVLANKS